MQDLSDVQVGQYVCVVGRGTANSVHAHYKVIRITKTMVVVAREIKGREVIRRYRFDGREVGASEYGGSYAHTTCQKKGS